MCMYRPTDPSIWPRLCLTGAADRQTGAVRISPPPPRIDSPGNGGPGRWQRKACNRARPNNKRPLLLTPRTARVAACAPHAPIPDCRARESAARQAAAKSPPVADGRSWGPGQILPSLLSRRRSSRSVNQQSERELHPVATCAFVRSVGDSRIEISNSSPTEMQKTTTLEQENGVRIGSRGMPGWTECSTPKGEIEKQKRTSSQALGFAY